jgi:hypothetical protein
MGHDGLLGVWRQSRFKTAEGDRLKQALLAAGATSPLRLSVGATGQLLLSLEQLQARRKPLLAGSDLARSQS